MDSANLLVGFMGDVMIGRGVDAIIATRGYHYVWGNTLPLLRGTDLNMANLETTLTTSEEEVARVFNFKASPDRIKCLEEAHVGMVNLANNHILDFGEEGLIETIAVLEAAGIQHTGAGKNLTAAQAPVIINRKNITLAVLGCTDNEPGWKASGKKCGTNYLDVSNKNNRRSILDAIEQLKQQSDHVVVSIHWGPNLKEYPDESFVSFAHEMIDHGASAIHGHSAHNFQGIEVYKNKLIFYDTGDFVDDYVVHAVLRNDHSFFFMVEFNKEQIIRVQLAPVLIANYQVNLAPQERAKWSLERMQELSKKFGTTIMKGEVLLTEQAAKIENP